MIKHKFKAKPVTDDGIRFASKKEHKRYTELKLLQKYGEVLFFLGKCLFIYQVVLNIYVTTWCSG